MDLSLRLSLRPESRDWRMASLTHCRVRGKKMETTTRMKGRSKEGPRGSRGAMGADLSLKEDVATSTSSQRLYNTPSTSGVHFIALLTFPSAVLNSPHVQNSSINPCASAYKLGKRYSSSAGPNNLTIPPLPTSSSGCGSGLNSIKTDNLIISVKHREQARNASAIRRSSRRTDQWIPTFSIPGFVVQSESHAPSRVR
ncbi:hypothetical protein JMJ77_0006608 [Colletotrichum scovillei]|uniref:Uncharacterized protein n=1 Tax=Colletotrichum scovillei TaxID=1209932 RepID=A0A9P7RJI6_9PEZI|nr:hypothetical protein JMJ77_0006608 [Colletotrichum scovillei]KAG7077789.1 hypothetical protein JMJ76_0015031 [Colletotrichum scovillei]